MGVGEQVLPWGGDHLWGAGNAGGAIQKYFFKFACGIFHLKNLNMLQAPRQEGYNL